MPMASGNGLGSAAFISPSLALKPNAMGCAWPRSWLQLGCLYIVGLTVSRGALLATAIGITIALRRLLRRGFIPLLVFIILSGIAYTFGVFDRMIILNYTDTRYGGNWSLACVAVGNRALPQLTTTRGGSEPTLRHTCRALVSTSHHTIALSTSHYRPESFRSRCSWPCGSGRLRTPSRLVNGWPMVHFDSRYWPILS